MVEDNLRRYKKVDKFRSIFAIYIVFKGFETIVYGYFCKGHKVVKQSLESQSREVLGLNDGDMRFCVWVHYFVLRIYSLASDTMYVLPPM